MAVALGFFAGGERLAQAFRTPALDWPEIEAHLAKGGAALILCDTPSAALAAALAEGADPTDALGTWTGQARKLIAVCDAYDERIALFLARDVLALPDEACRVLAQQFGIEADEKIINASPGSPLHALVADAFVAGSSDAAVLADALNTSARRITPAAPIPANPAFALDELQALTNEAAAAREDAALLRAHLHLVQSQLETWRERARETGPRRAGQDETRIAALKSELAAARAEAESYRASLSWRLTAPLRALASLMPRGLSPESLRLGRQIALICDSGLFDAEWYRHQYADLADSRLDPAEHYLRFGWREGRRPGPDFDGPGYLRVNPDVAAQGINPLIHYLQQGRNEGRPLAPRLARPEPS